MPEHVQRLHLVRVPTFLGSRDGPRPVRVIDWAWAHGQRIDHGKTGPPGKTSRHLNSDPDAPTGSGFWHWLVVNIPATASELAEGAGGKGGKLPQGAQTRTDFGAPGYGGPFPPEGDHPHRYLFTVFAVKAEKLDVKPDTSGPLSHLDLSVCSMGLGVSWPAVTLSAPLR
jgi:Raf kinase inhibitor-like YbhB/YbcL family protein